MRQAPKLGPLACTTCIAKQRVDCQSAVNREILLEDLTLQDGASGFEVNRSSVCSIRQMSRETFAHMYGYVRLYVCVYAHKHMQIHNLPMNIKIYV